MHNDAMIQDQNGAHDIAYAWFQKAAALGLDASQRNCSRMEASGKIQKQL
ncbi:MAG: hypothetical protein LCH26_00425 [Proteobacteria bacterium]|nr:hypothetical protein [Pseudomonadota bacterium]